MLKDTWQRESEGNRVEGVFRVARTVRGNTETKDLRERRVDRERAKIRKDIGGGE